MKIISRYTPKYQTKDAAGFDLECNETVKIKPGETVMIDLGFRCSIPKGYFLMLVPRSSIVKRHLALANSVGIIDADYRGPVKGLFYNYGNKLVKVRKGDRLIQGILIKVEQTTFENVENLDDTERGEGGFGHTGE